MIYFILFVGYRALHYCFCKVGNVADDIGFYLKSLAFLVMAGVGTIEIPLKDTDEVIICHSRDVLA